MNTILAYPKYKNTTGILYGNNRDNRIPGGYVVIGLDEKVIETTLYNLLSRGYEIC